MSLEAALNGGKAKRNKEVGSTLRFDVKLDNPTDSSTNEVHYNDLLSKENCKDVVNAPDPFHKDEDAEVEALARKFEEKYGSTKRKRVREEDLIDIGDGYDLNDPFVDDEEAYEDYVPHEVDTILGGFYINAGSLEYKKAEGTEEIQLKKKSKPTLKKQTSTPKARLASKKVKLAKQQIATSAQRSETIKKKLSSLAKSNNLFPASKKPYSSNSNGFSDSNTNTSASLVKREETSDTTNEYEPKKKEPVFETVPIFPSDIPPSVESKIKRIETMISETEGKLTMKARYAYDSILLEIESEARGMKLKNRSAIFDYLAYIMGITKGSLVNRIKRTIKKNKGSSQGESTLQLLKEEIDKILPAYVSKYDKEMAEYEAALKASATASSFTPSVDQQDKLEISDDFQTPSGVTKPPGEIFGTKLKKPRKILKWTPTLKALLCDVVREKVELEMANKERTKSGEEVILDFLQTTIKPLWPKGWFVKKTLYNITQAVHTELTGYQRKVTIKKDKQSEESQQKPNTVSSPDLSVLPSEEGSTQASLGSVLQSVPASTQQTTPKLMTPPNPSTSSAAIPSSKNNDTKSFKGVVKSSSLAAADSVTPVKSQQGAKPTLLPTKHFQGSSSSSPTPSTAATKPSSIAKPATFSKTSTSKPISLDPVVSVPTIKLSNQPTTAATTVIQKGPVNTVNVQKGTHKVGGGGGGGGGGTVTQKVPALQTVTQKGPSKVAKVQVPDIHLSQKDLDNLIRSLRTNQLPALPTLSMSPQQLQLLIQHSNKSQKQKSSSSSSSSKVAAAPSLPPHSSKKNTNKASSLGAGKSVVTSVNTPLPSVTSLPSSSTPRPLPSPTPPKHLSSPIAMPTPNWTSPVHTASTQPMGYSTPNTGSGINITGSPNKSPVVRKANISGMSIMGNSSGSSKMGPGGGMSPIGTLPGPGTTSAFNFNELALVPHNPPRHPQQLTNPIHTVAHSSSGIRPHAVSVVQNQAHKMSSLYYSTSSEHNYSPSLASNITTPSPTNIAITHSQSISPSSNTSNTYQKRPL